MQLKGARLLVVGASAGIGRAVAVAAAAAGADVVAAARRAAPLDDCRTVAADVTTDEGRAAIVEAVDDLDAVVYAAGRADLAPLTEVDAGSWQRTLDVNVVAFNLLVPALVPRLTPAAVVVALSTESAHAPRSSLVAYAASKAALETSVAGWRIEHPRRRFSVVAVGPTQPTEFGAGFTGDALRPALADWSRRGLMQQETMATDEVAAVLVDLLGTALANPSVGIEHVVLRPPSDLA